MSGLDIGSQTPIADYEVAPPASRLLITLVLDTSESMRRSGGIAQLNAALPTLRDALLRNPHVAKNGEIALITFGKDHVQVRSPSGRAEFDHRQPYVPVREFNPSQLEAGGVTPMTEALQRAFMVISERKEQLYSQGIGMSFRPLLYVMTDGFPTDDRGHLSENYRELTPVLREWEKLKKVLFFTMRTDEANEGVLRELAPRDGQRYGLSGLDFSSLILLVSASADRATAKSGASAEEIYRDTNEHYKTMNEYLRG